MQSLRKPFFILALALIAICIIIEIGRAATLQPATTTALDITSELPSDTAGQLSDDQKAQVRSIPVQTNIPGMAIPYMALLDGVALFTAALMGLGLVIPARLQGRVQGIGTLIFAILLILAALVMIPIAIGLVTLMVALLLSIPFGTIVYLIVYGHFDRSGAAAVLSVLMLLKLGFAGSLVLAQQRFLQNWGLVLIVITCLLGNVIISFLHGLVPRFLVSITDGIGAIIVAILAVIWAIFLLIGSIPAILFALRVSKT
jgi:hypothetical protein